jgi:hypothetical protein
MTSYPVERPYPTFALVPSLAPEVTAVKVHEEALRTLADALKARDTKVAMEIVKPLLKNR